MAGSAHAEIMALRNAALLGHATSGATAYVTLEPCAHQGRTGPCCDALVAAGVRRVVASIEDPNPLVAGQGFARLRAAGIGVQVGPGAAASRELNLGFFSRMVRKTPWVRLKLAASLDSRTALPNGQSQWITSTESRADTHAWRARACAIMTGVGTLLADLPHLNVRGVSTPRQPALVVVDSHLRSPVDVPAFEVPRPVYLYTCSQNLERTEALQRRGVLVLPAPSDGAGQVALAFVLSDLAQRGINELHVEAGQTLNGALLRSGLADEILLYLAPKLLGPGLGLANLPTLDHLNDAAELEFHATDRVGPDLRLLARLRGRDAF